MLGRIAQTASAIQSDKGFLRSIHTLKSYERYATQQP
ncbi:hypothetical protein HNR46_004307 [Haloferula luteola]|uniref:Uncharacterized protein n=1 Tax=Haloferula luteola TaxID=595692 RepID=A0A840V7P0_9BACT|nr:hypothetical protein [Haloferula luteola]